MSKKKLIRRLEIKPDNEYLVLSFMIMNPDVINTAFRRYESKQLKTVHFTKSFRTIFRWLIMYYAKHKKPPKGTIQEIFRAKEKLLTDDQAEIISEYLETIASEYAEAEENGIDPSYIELDVIPNFIRERELANRIEKAKDQIERNDFEQAEQIISSYEPVSEETEDENLGTIIPLSIKDIKESQKNPNENEVAYRFQNSLDFLFGSLQKTWLVAVTAVEKAGKSFFLQELAYRAAIYQKKKVLIINIELAAPIVRRRFHRRISQTVDERYAGEQIYPILDCENNQFGTCEILKRLKNKDPLFNSIADTVSYWQRKRWIICRKCKDEKTKKNAKRTKRFVPALWFERDKFRPVTHERVLRAVKRNIYSHIENIHVKCFPRFSVTFDEVESYIRRYISKSGFHPEILIWDYLDILAPENKDFRIDIDQKWKKASRLAAQLNCLLFTADQANKASRKQYSLDQMSTSESKTKDSHLDVRIAINQTDEERALGLVRTSCLFHRHAAFDVNREAIITQRLITSQPLTDSAILFDAIRKYRVTNKPI